MEARFERVNEVGDELLKSALETAAYHNGIISSNKDYSIVIANTLCTSVSGLAEVMLSIPVDEKITNFIISDISGEPIEFEVAEKKREKRDVFSAINLPGVIDVDTYRIYLPVKEMKPMSFQCFKVSAKSGSIDFVSDFDLTNTFFENDNLAVEVANDGAVNILCKSSGRKIVDCFSFVDTADIGSSYNFKSANDKPIMSKSFKPSIRMIENNKYKSVCSISYDMELPECFDFENKTRSQTMITEHCELILTLTTMSKYLEVEYKIDNKAKDHRFRLVVNTDVIADNFIADIPFDIITHEDDDIHPFTKDNVHPNTSFAAIESNKNALAVFTEGAHGCAKLDKNKLAFTLVRSTRAIDGNAGKQWYTPENQCLRQIEGRLAVYPYILMDNVNLFEYSSVFRNPILSMAVPGDSHRFTGGRPAVQDSTISELFFREDKYSNVCITNDMVLNCSNNLVSVTAFKMATDNDGIIVRLYNTSSSKLNTKVTIKGEIFASNMNESILEPLGKNEVTVDIRGKQILTLYVLNKN